MTVPDWVVPPTTPLTLQAGEGMPPVTVAVSWTLVAVYMLAGAPEIATVGTVGELVNVTVAVTGVCGNSLFASIAS